jgi:hypothetical protein
MLDETIGNLENLKSILEGIASLLDDLVSVLEETGFWENNQDSRAEILAAISILEEIVGK